MPDMPKVGVAVLIVKDDQLLLLKRSGVHGAGTWSTPGGHLEFGESPEECAAREAREETSLTVCDVQYIGLTNDVFLPSAKHYITIWTKVLHFVGEPRIGAPEEMSGIGWFPWTALPQPLFLPLQHLLDGCCYPVDALGYHKLHK